MKTSHCFRTCSRVLVALVAAGVIYGCTQQPRPAPLVAATDTRHSPAIQQDRDLAPQQFARAEALRQRAEDLYEQDQITASSIVAERAIVAYERVAVIARLARAQLNESQADKQLASLSTKQQTMDAEQGRLKADIEAMQQLIKVVQDARPLEPSAPTDASREQARLAAARAIAVDAQLLCSAAQLINPRVEGLAQALNELIELQSTLAKWPKPAPIDTANALRNNCLSLLTLARTDTATSSRAAPQSTQTSAHSATSSSGSTKLADEVLLQLSQAGNLAPSIDDRGVIVIVRGDPTRDELAKHAIQALANTAKNNANYPIQVVAHTRARPTAQAKQHAAQRSQAVVDALKNAGIEANRIALIDAAHFRPVVHDPIPPPTNSQNDRIEVVLVAPSR